MTLEPLLSAPWVIQVHVAGAMLGLLLGVLQFLAPKGTLPHKTIGVFWIVILSTVAVTSIFVRPSIKPGLPFFQWFSFIHIFTVITFYGLAQGMLFLVRGGKNLKMHSRPFLGIFIGGLIVAGILAFALPGRIMHKVVFGG
ncbi:MAG: hypothetical protein R3C60_13290 [Parvularculaceae bacterium]